MSFANPSCNGSCEELVPSAAAFFLGWVKVTRMLSLNTTAVTVFGHCGDLQIGWWVFADVKIDGAYADYDSPVLHSERYE